MARFKAVVECHIPSRDEIHVLTVTAENRNDAIIRAIYKARERWPEAQTVTVRRTCKMPEVQSHGG